MRREYMERALSICEHFESWMQSNIAICNEPYPEGLGSPKAVTCIHDEGLFIEVGDFCVFDSELHNLEENLNFSFCKGKYVDNVKAYAITAGLYNNV